MPTKEEKRAELEAEYAKHLEEIEAEGDTADDDGNTDDEIVVHIKGEAKKEFLAALQATGLSKGEAQKEADKIDDKTGDKKDKKTDDKTPPVSDPKPPSRSRYFGGR